MPRCMRSDGAGILPSEVICFMRLGVKAILCILLMLLAVWSLAAVLGSIGAIPVSGPAEEDGYLLREYEGYVAVWYPAEATYPAMITDISTGDLPLTDRVELRGGIPAADRDEVMRLLEDFAA